MKKYKPGTAIIFSPTYSVPEQHPLKWGEVVYYLSDIPNVPGHCLVAKYSGQVVAMVHPEDFRIPDEDEL